MGKIDGMSIQSSGVTVSCTLTIDINGNGIVGFEQDARNDSHPLNKKKPLIKSISGGIIGDYDEQMVGHRQKG